MLKDPHTLLGVLERLGNVLRATQRQVAGESGLQLVHLQALVYLGHCNRFSNTPQALADYLGLTKGTVSQSLLLLDRRGLIERYVDGDDRRVVRLRLSDLGHSLLDEQGLQAPWRAAVRDVSVARIRAAVSILREVLVLLQDEVGAVQFGSCDTCVHLARRSARLVHCEWYAERLSVADTRALCRSHQPRPGSARRDRHG